MIRPKKITLLISGGILILLLLGALALLGPTIVNSDYVKAKIVAQISRRTGGRAEIGSVRFSIFPRPHAVVKSTRLEIPGRLTAKFGSITLYLRIWPLLRGKLVLARVMADTPEINADLPRAGAGGSYDNRDLRDRLVISLTSIVTEAGDISLKVENGLVNLSRGGAGIFRFSHVHMLLSNVSGKVQANLSCTSNLWNGLDMKGVLDLNKLSSQAEIDVKGFRTGILNERACPARVLGVGAGETDLHIRFRGNIKGEVEARVKAVAPILPLIYNGQKAVFKGVNVDGTVNITEQETALRISGLTMEYPALHLSGEFLLDRSSSRMSLNLVGKEIHVPSLRRVVLLLAKDSTTVQRIFTIVRAGKVPLVKVKSGGKSVSALADLGNLLISGSIQDGEIGIPRLNMRLEEVSGDALISGGLLKGSHLEARLGKTTGTSGTLSLGLGADDDRFRLDIMLMTDLEQALGEIKDLVKEGRLKRELMLIDQIRGKARARLVLGDTVSSMNVGVDASQVDLSARYRPVPYPIEMKGGRVSYSDDLVTAAGVAGAIGRSSFTGVSGVFDWRGELRLEVESARAHILLDQIYPWIASFRKPGKAPGQVKEIAGALTVKALSFKGPIMNPAQWDFNAECSVRDLALSSPLLPGPVHVEKAAFRADPGHIAVKDAELKILDAELKVSGDAAGTVPAGIEELKAAIYGNLGIKAVQAVSDLIDMPDTLRVRSPIAVSESLFRWRRHGETSFEGKLSASGGADLSLDVRNRPGDLRIANLTLKDWRSDLSFGCHITGDILSGYFSGHLNSKSLGFLTLGGGFPGGWVKGEIQARFIPAHMVESSMEGKLEGRDITFPGLPIPAELKDFSVEAGGGGLRLKSAELLLNKAPLNATGTIKALDRGVMLNLDLSGRDLDLKPVIDLFNKKNHGPEEGDGRDAPGGRGKRWPFSLRGAARVGFDSLAYGGLRWDPFQCTVTLGNEGVKIEVSKADLCGVSTPGVVSITLQGVDLDFRPAATDGNLATTAACLSGENMKIEGSFELESHLTGKGSGPLVLESLRGPFRFTARNGLVHRDPILARVLSFLNITEIFKGNIPSLSEKGFSFRSVTAEGDLKGKKLHLKRAMMFSPSLNMACTGTLGLTDKSLDLELLASPFTTVDSVIKRLPVIGYILNDTLISVAAKVTGTMDDPKVEYLPASEVGKGLMGIVERTFKAPVKLVEPLFTGGGKKQETGP